MARTILSATNITKEYPLGKGTVKVLKGISLQVEEGSFLSIMGPSGAGKSTLMHILGCLDTPTSGTYILDGEDVSKMDDAKLSRVRNAKIGFVFQAFHLIPWATALENVMLPFLYSREVPKDALQRAKAALERMGMGKRLNHKPSELSGGQQQRVAIARAIVNNPAMIMADEPTGNLDSAASEEVMEIFKEMNREGRTIILITHDPEIAAYASKTLFIRDGVIQSS